MCTRITCRESDLVALGVVGWGLRFCISYQLPDDADEDHTLSSRIWRLSRSPYTYTSLPIPSSLQEFITLHHSSPSPSLHTSHLVPPSSPLSLLAWTGLAPSPTCGVTQHSPLHINSWPMPGSGFSVLYSSYHLHIFVWVLDYVDYSC